ncbi:hypothetical protein [Rhodoflexus sp.]
MKIIASGFWAYICSMNRWYYPYPQNYVVNPTDYLNLLQLNVLIIS